jgi:HEAT repeat protein
MSMNTVTRAGNTLIGLGLAGACALAGCRTPETARVEEESDVRMVSPKVVSIHTPDASSPESVVRGIVKPGMTPEQKALAVWEYCWKNTWHWPAPKEDGRENHELDVVFDAVKQLNVYGYTYCFATRSLAEALYEAAGLEARSGGIGGHVVPEVYYQGRYHYLDHDQRGFSRLPDGTIAAVADFRGKPDLVLHPTGPSTPFFPSEKKPTVPYEDKHVFAGYMLNHDVHYSQHDKFRTTHSMNVGLRPGERFVRSWSNVGKWHWLPSMTAAWKTDSYGDMWEGPRDPYADLFPEARRGEDGKPLAFGNGLMIYRPNLAAGARDYADGVWRDENVDGRGPGFQPAAAGKPAAAEFRVRLPYAIVGWPGDIGATNANITGAAVVSGRCVRRTAEDRAAVLLSVGDGATWKEVWTASALGEQDFAVDISKFVEGKYGYLVRFSLRAAGSAADARILNFGIDTACQLNPAVLPAVRAGRNEMTVTMEPGPEVYEETIQYGGPCKAAHDRLVRDLKGFAIEPGAYPALKPVEPRKPGHVVYEMAAPDGAEIVWARVGGCFRAYWGLDADERFRVYYSADRPGKWKLLYEADQAPYLQHWCFESNSEIKLEKPAKRIFVKYELSRGRHEGGKLVGARLAWGCRRGANRVPAGGIRMTHVYTEDGAERRQSQVVSGHPQAYSFDVPGKDVRNVSVAMEWAGRPPCVEGPSPLMTAPPKVERREVRDLEQIGAMREALARLGKTPDVKTAAEIIRTCKHTWTKSATVAALLAMGGEDAQEELRKLIGTQDWARGCLLELLIREGPTADLVEFLAKADGEGRAKLAPLLADRGDSAALTPLREAIAKEDNSTALGAELTALARLGGADVVDEVEKRVARCDDRTRLNIASALAAGGAREGFEWLNAGLRSADRYTRYRAAAGLAESGKPAAEPGLLRALRDDSRWVRQAATAGLARSGGPASIKPLTAMAEKDPEAYLRAEAEWALGEVRKREAGR